METDPSIVTKVYERFLLNSVPRT